MATAKELGMSQAEFEDAMNLEKMYMLVTKTDCKECGKTPVTYAKIGSWELLCNDCGKSSNASKIATTHFKGHEVASFEKAINGSRKSGGTTPDKRSPKKSGRKSGLTSPPIPVKKARQKRKRYSTSSSSTPPTPSPSSSSSSSEIVKRRSRKKAGGRNRSRRCSSLTPTNYNHGSNPTGNRQRVASMPVTGAYYDPIHPPSAFPGSDQQYVGMNAIKAQEQDLMQQHQSRNNVLVPAYNQTPYDGKKGLPHHSRHSNHHPPPLAYPRLDGSYTNNSHDIKGNEYPWNLLVSPPRNITYNNSTNQNENYPPAIANMPMLPVPPPHHNRWENRVRTSWSDGYYNSIPSSYSPNPYNNDINNMYSPQGGSYAFMQQPPPTHNLYNQQQPTRSYQPQHQQQIGPGNPFSNVPHTSQYDTNIMSMNKNRNRYPWRNENNYNFRGPSPLGAIENKGYNNAVGLYPNMHNGGLYENAFRK